MRVSGVWRLCDDEITRPTFWAEMCSASGEWIAVPFLADSGVDRTVLSADIFELLAFSQLPNDQAILGLGGAVQAFEFPSVLRMRRADGVTIHFRGRFAAWVDPTALDMSVLGRDITNLLALVIDRPGNSVCLLSRGEVYQA